MLNDIPWTNEPIKIPFIKPPSEHDILMHERSEQIENTNYKILIIQIFYRNSFCYFREPFARRSCLKNTHYFMIQLLPRSDQEC